MPSIVYTLIFKSWVGVLKRIYLIFQKFCGGLVYTLLSSFSAGVQTKRTPRNSTPTVPPPGLFGATFSDTLQFGVIDATRAVGMLPVWIGAIGVRDITPFGFSFLIYLTFVWFSLFSLLMYIRSKYRY